MCGTGALAAAAVSDRQILLPSSLPPFLYPSGNSSRDKVWLINVRGRRTSDGEREIGSCGRQRREAAVTSCPGSKNLQFIPEIRLENKNIIFTTGDPLHEKASPARERLFYSSKMLAFKDSTSSRSLAL